MRTNVAFDHATYAVEFEIEPADHDVGVGEGIDIGQILDAAGHDLDIDAVAAREGLTYDAAEARLTEACEEAANDRGDDEAERYLDRDDLEVGFDPYMGQYSDDC